MMKRRMRIVCQQIRENPSQYRYSAYSWQFRMNGKKNEPRWTCIGPVQGHPKTQLLANNSHFVSWGILAAFSSTCPEDLLLILPMLMHFSTMEESSETRPCGVHSRTNVFISCDRSGSSSYFRQKEKSLQRWRALIISAISAHVVALASLSLPSLSFLCLVPFLA